MATATKKKAMSKSALFAALAEHTELKKSDVVKLFEGMHELMKKELGGKGPGVFTFPGVARFKVRKVKAVKGGQKKMNPITKTEYITKDRPAHNKVGIRPVKAFAEELK